VVLSSAFVFDSGPPHRVTFRFSQDVVSSIGAEDFTVTGPSGAVPFTLAYESVTNTATLSFDGFLPNGNYTARAIAGGITNSIGELMPVDATLDFFALAGDINRDRSVNGTDFAILAGNFGKTGQAFTQGDLTGDGFVNGSDFAILAGNFGKTVPAPAAQQGVRTALPAPRALAAPRPLPVRRAAPTKAPSHAIGRRIVPPKRSRRVSGR
jgi:hypothetical protein